MPNIYSFEMMSYFLNYLFQHIEPCIYVAHELQKLAMHKLVGVPIVRDQIQFLLSVCLISPNCHGLYELDR